MKISWNPNPFFSTLELDDRDEQLLLVAYQNEEYAQLLIELDWGFTGKYGSRELFTSLDQPAKIIEKWQSICNLEVSSPEIQRYIAFAGDMHMGDCICVPCTCVRCLAEEMLGVSTLEGLGKHLAHKVYGAFGTQTCINAALDNLLKPYTYEKRSPGYDNYTRESYEGLCTRWNKERKQAHIWLSNYKQKHGF